MSIFKPRETNPRYYLLLPAMPTPNGRLHLGHMGGPFLKMDVLARSYRRKGHHAEVMSASDVYESYTLLKAHQTGQPVEEVCHRFHQLIQEDLAALMIDCTYINPLDPAYREKVDRTYRDTLQQLDAAQATVSRTEQVLYSPSADKYIAGAWLRGECPHCHSGAGSYLCEACGMQFNPEDVMNPTSVTGETDLEPVPVPSLFLKVHHTTALLQHIRRMGVPELYPQIVERYLQRYQQETRLTNPGNWGTPYGADALQGNNYQVIFPYSGLLSLSRVCGELFAEKNGLTQNPFDTGATVTTIASFGIDSTIPWFAGVLGSCMATNTIRPFDYFLTNHFYRLEGAKFSTSRMHAIWASDIVHKTTASVDAVRYYLTKNNPEYEEKDFFIQDFIGLNNDFLVKKVQAYIHQCWQQLDRAAVLPLPEQLGHAVEQAVAEQAHSFEPPHQHMAGGVSVMEQWLDQLSSHAEWEVHPYWALKSLALLAYPVMPLLGTTLWKALTGREEEPSAAAFPDNSGRIDTAPLPHFFELLHYHDLLPCLPATLTSTAPVNGKINGKTPGIRLPFLPPEIEKGIMKVDEINLMTHNRHIAPFKASRFEVYPGQTSPSDQHEVRECWFIAQGAGDVLYNGKETVPVTQGDVLYFESHQTHEITNTGKVNLVIFSVWWNAATTTAS